MPDRQKFIDAMMPYAQQWAQQTGIPAEVFIAIGASETNWGATGTFFGIKGSGTAGTKNYDTWEMVDGKRVNTKDNFAVYNDPNDAFEHFIGLISTGRYKPAWEKFQQSGDWQGLLAGVNGAGYATDPNWSKNIASITQQISGKPVENLKPVEAAGGNSAVDAGLTRIQPPTPKDYNSEEERFNHLTNLKNKGVAIAPEADAFLRSYAARPERTNMPTPTGPVQDGTRIEMEGGSYAVYYEALGKYVVFEPALSAAGFPVLDDKGEPIFKRGGTFDPPTVAGADSTLQETRSLPGMDGKNYDYRISYDKQGNEVNRVLVGPSKDQPAPKAKTAAQAALDTIRGNTGSGAPTGGGAPSASTSSTGTINAPAGSQAAMSISSPEQAGVNLEKYPDYHLGDKPADGMGPAIDTNIGLLQGSQLMKQGFSPNYDVAATLQAHGIKPSGDRAKDAAAAQTVIANRGALQSMFPGATPASIASFQQGSMTNTQKGLDASPTLDQTPPTPFLQNPYQFDPQNFLQAEGGINMAGDVQSRTMPNGFTTPNPVAIVDLATGQPKAIAGEAGPEKIKVIPQDGTDANSQFAKVNQALDWKDSLGYPQQEPLGYPVQESLGYPRQQSGYPDQFSGIMAQYMDMMKRLNPNINMMASGGYADVGSAQGAVPQSGDSEFSAMGRYNHRVSDFSPYKIVESKQYPGLRYIVDARTGRPVQLDEMTVGKLDPGLRSLAGSGRLLRWLQEEYDAAQPYQSGIAHMTRSMGLPNDPGTKQIVRDQYLNSGAAQSDALAMGMGQGNQPAMNAMPNMDNATMAFGGDSGGVLGGVPGLPVERPNYGDGRGGRGDGGQDHGGGRGNYSPPNVPPTPPPPPAQLPFDAFREHGIANIPPQFMADGGQGMVGMQPPMGQSQMGGMTQMPQQPQMPQAPISPAPAPTPQMDPRMAMPSYNPIPARTLATMGVQQQGGQQDAILAQSMMSKRAQMESMGVSPLLAQEIVRNQAATPQGMQKLMQAMPQMQF